MPTILPQNSNRIMSRLPFIVHQPSSPSTTSFVIFSLHRKIIFPIPHLGPKAVSETVSQEKAVFDTVSAGLNFETSPSKSGDVRSRFSFNANTLSHLDARLFGQMISKSEPRHC
jgi:hypothetical protein